MPETPTFGRYRADRRLASGAFATVWLAHDDILDSPVAVKVLADNWSDRLDIRNRFLDEARILRRADSDHVVRVHDIGELADGRPYFVMTYADRGTLADRIDGALAEDAVLEYARSVAAGLAVLHRLGVVHRDVKPSNVLFHSAGDQDRVLIADLGLARAVAHASGFTLAAGTPGYMAPEQSAMAGGVDARADVYALGALIIRMSTGRAPRPVWDGATAALALQDAVSIPGQLGAVARKALDPDPERRYDSAVEMADALESAVVLGGTDRVAGGVDGVGTSEVGAALPTLPIAAGPPPVPVAAVHADRRDGHTRVPPDPGERSPVPPHRTRPGRLVRTRARRMRLVAAAAGMALVAAGAYAYADAHSGPVTVSDDQHRITVQVPSSWAGQYRGAGWSLAPFGVPQRSPGLAVSSDYRDWQDPTDPTAGLFVGYTTRLSGEPDLGLLKRITHPGCHRGPVRHIRAGGYSGLAQQWDRCRASGVAYDEVIAHPAGKPAATIYLQVKGPVDPARTRTLLRSVHLS